MSNHHDVIDLDVPPPEGLRRVASTALVVGLAGAVLCVVGALADPNQFFHSYLTAFMLWFGIALGSLALAMVQYLTGGVWAFVLRRPLEAASRALPLIAVLFVPILFGLHVLYPWTDPGIVARTEALRQKSGYLNVPFFVIRAAAFFVIWIALAYFVNRWSADQDRTGDAAYLRKLQRLSGPGLVIYAFTVTFAVVDWVMSLEPLWYSTIFGMIFMAGQGISALAFGTLVIIQLSRTEPVAGLLRVTTMRDVGNMVLAFVMLWAYTSFSQLLLIWAGNLPEEIPWYMYRLGPAWQWIGLILGVFHFFVPFVLLLMRKTKATLPALRAVVVLLLVMRLVDLFWNIGPETYKGALVVSWQDFATTVAVGGLFVAFFARQLASRPLLPLRDPVELAAALKRH
ncbi:MAG: hypothetical protein ACM3NQ_03085 [Bacteroidales bacterium]